MRAGLDLARARWRSLSPGMRTLCSVGLALIALVLLAEAWSWQKSERLRLAAQLSQGDARVRRMQDEAAEAQNLRGRQPPPALTGQALADTVTASLRGRKLDLAVTAQGTDRLRVQGMAGFDDAIAWLGTVQRDYRLRLLTLTATRQPGQGASRFDAVLTTAAP